ncbi:hypothetical protein MPTK2_2g11750 [Marchantia polymorpha subsp. ruderalis]
MDGIGSISGPAIAETPKKSEIFPEAGEASAAESFIDIGGGYGSEDEPPRRNSRRNNPQFTNAHIRVYEYELRGGSYQKSIKYPRHNDYPGKGAPEKKAPEELAPEQRINIFALRLAFLEKLASSLGALAFLWATGVLLGGFATSLNETDFSVLTVIILAESSRIFSRSHELELYQFSVKKAESKTLMDLVRAASTSTVVTAVLTRLRDLLPPAAGVGHALYRIDHVTRHRNRSTPSVVVATTVLLFTGRIKDRAFTGKIKDRARTVDPTSVQIVPWTHHTKLISRLLYVVQLISAIGAIGMASWRLRIHHYFYNPGNSQPMPPNLTLSMTMFYVLAVAQASLFLVERFLWEYQMRVAKILNNVNSEAGLGDENLQTVKMFFYQVYSRCLKGSVFDGLHMDLVSFSFGWLQEEDYQQQLAAARLLKLIVNVDPLAADPRAADCLRRMGNTPGVIERLVEMLSWNTKNESALLCEVAVIVSRLAKFSRNCCRIAVIPGAIDAIVSLLIPHGGSSTDEAQLSLRLYGLQILKLLCRLSQDNRIAVGESRHLLAILVLFLEIRQGKTPSEKGTNPEEKDDLKAVFQNLTKVHFKYYKKSLQILESLASATDVPGSSLRVKISRVVSGLKNLRDIIHYGDGQPVLQHLSMRILYHLALEEKVRVIMGATGGIMSQLFGLFSGDIESLETDDLENNVKLRQEASIMAGRAINRIILQNKKNSLKLTTLLGANGDSFFTCTIRFISKSVESTKMDSHIREMATCSARILRTVLEFVDDSVRTNVAEKCARNVMQHIIRKPYESRSELYESYLGLASLLLRGLQQDTYDPVVRRLLHETKFMEQALHNLKHIPDRKEFSRIRRYTLELLIAILDKDTPHLSFYGVLVEKRISGSRLEDLLQHALASFPEVENFCLFSGLCGYARDNVEMEDLVTQAIQKLKTYEASRRGS